MNYQQKLVTAYHMIMCDCKHPIDMNKFKEEKSEDICNWYLEECLDTSWKEPDHLKWINETDSFMITIGNKDYEKVYNLIANILEKLHDMLKFIDGDQHLMHIYIKALAILSSTSSTPSNTSSSS
jgi:hypothetical protein